MKSETKEIFLTSSQSKELIIALQRENCDLKKTLDGMSSEVQQLLQTLESQNKDIDLIRSDNKILTSNCDDLRRKLEEYEALFKENDADFAIDLQIIEKLQVESRQLSVELQAEQDAKNKLAQEYASLREEYSRVEIDHESNLNEMA